MKVYLDSAATTKVDKEVIAEMLPYLEDHYGNPSSIHGFGRETRSKIEKCRKSISSIINCSPSEVFFTSSGTEANNTILKRCVRDLGVKHIVSSEIEHHCVGRTLEEIEKEWGAQVHYVSFLPNGHVDLESLENIVKGLEGKVLVSLMHANNEIGNMINLNKVGKIVKEYDCLWHSDTVQTLGHYTIDVQKLGIDFISGSGHKIHGPKGIGLMYINGDVKIKPYIVGGAQERNMRAGTENLHGIVGFAKALELQTENLQEDMEYIQGLKSYMIEKLRENIPGVVFNGDAEGKSLYTVLNVCLPDFADKDMLLFNLDIMGVAASGGSACSSGSAVGSHVLRNIGAEVTRPNVRFSFSKFTTKEELDYTVEKLKEIYAKEMV